MSNIPMPIPERHPNGVLPVVSVKERSQGFTAYDSNTVTPYIQNINVELQHQLAKNLTLEVRYIGSKGTKLENTLHLNNPIVEENGLLDAFRTTQQGGNAPLFDQMLTGLNVPGVGVVNGSSITGSSAMRRWSSTVSFLANNDVRGLANFLNQSNFGTGEIGGLIRRAGLPENFIVTNPQYGSQTFGRGTGPRPGFLQATGCEVGTGQRVGRRERVQAPAGEPNLPGLAGDVTRHKRRVTRDRESIGDVNEGFVSRPQICVKTSCR